MALSPRAHRKHSTIEVRPEQGAHRAETDHPALLRANGIGGIHTFHLQFSFIRLLVPGAGVEPARPEGQGILSPPRMPFRHPGTVRASLTY